MTEGAASIDESDRIHNRENKTVVSTNEDKNNHGQRQHSARRQRLKWPAADETTTPSSLSPTNQSTHYYYPFGAGAYHFPARTQLVSTKHRRLKNLDWEPTSTPLRSWYGGKTKKHMSISSQHYCIELVAKHLLSSGRLDASTDLHPLTTIAKQARFTSFSFLFYSRPI